MDGEDREWTLLYYGLLVGLSHSVVATSNYLDTPPAIFDSLSAAKVLVANICCANHASHICDPV